MSTPVQNLTIPAIADSIGLKLTDTSHISFIERDANLYIRAVLRDALAFFHVARSAVMTTSHIDMVLESRDLPPLQGYQNPPTYSIMPITVEQADLYPPREIPVHLTDVIGAPACREIPNEHNIRWVLVEGSPSGKSSLPRRRDIPKGAKIERSISVPIGSDFRHIESSRSSSSLFEVDLAAETADKHADDILSPALQKFFRSAINLLKCDSISSFDSTLEIVTTQDQIQPLVPYFLHWAFGRLTLNLDNYPEVRSVLFLTIAIASNEFVNIGLYTHPLLKIAMTGLLSVSFVCSDAIADVEVRRVSTRLLRIVCDRSEFSFPSIRTVVFNRLIEAVYDTETGLGVSYAALSALRELGLDFGYMIPHLGILVSALQNEMDYGLFPQTLLAARVLELLQEIMGPDCVLFENM
jgi:hypothetical protein